MPVDKSLHPDYPPELLFQASEPTDPAQSPVAAPRQQSQEPDYASTSLGVNDGDHTIYTQCSYAHPRAHQPRNPTSGPVLHDASGPSPGDSNGLRDNPFAPLSEDYPTQTRISSTSSSIETTSATMQSDRLPPPFPGGCQLCRAAAGQDT